MLFNIAVTQVLPAGTLNANVVGIAKWRENRGPSAGRRAFQQIGIGASRWHPMPTELTGAR